MIHMEKAKPESVSQNMAATAMCKLYTSWLKAFQLSVWPDIHSWLSSSTVYLQ